MESLFDRELAHRLDQGAMIASMVLPVITEPDDGPDLAMVIR